jgi:hypothetical protein
MLPPFSLWLPEKKFFGIKVTNFEKWIIIKYRRRKGMA